MTDLPPPGYYPDPEDPTRRRWWDGTQWGPPEPRSFRPAIDPRSAFENERRMAALVVRALLVGIVVYIAAAAIQVSTADETRAQFRETVDALEENRAPDQDVGQTNAGVAILSQVLAVGQVAVGALFIAWSYRAAKVAQALALPNAWSPTWAICGWIPPLYFAVPYFATRSWIPPDHPARATVGRWWSSWIAMLVGGLIVLFAPIAFEVPTALLAACTLGYAVLVIAAGLAARAVVQEVAAVHAAYVGAAEDQSPNW